jgi:hypothetical protein
MASYKTLAIYTNETNGAAADVTVFTNPAAAAVTTRAIQVRTDPDALVPTKGWVSIALPVGGGADLVLDLQGRMTDEDSFATVLAAPWVEADVGVKLVDIKPQMKFVLTTLDASGGAGLTVRLTYLNRGAPDAIAVGTLAANRDADPTI